MTSEALGARESREARSGLRTASLAALGIVFGDIGTSPLYTLKTVLGVTGEKAAAGAALGSLSLIVWTLIIVASIKYVTLAMRVDNDGEGGILALMSLLGVKRQSRPAIVAVGLFGAALIYGDGAITPAISVLSALEGLSIATPAFERFVLPLSVLVLVGLFTFQKQGTARIGGAFGPIMILWFVVIGILGISGIIRHPGVLAAIDPRYGLAYLSSSGTTGFLVLGSVFLCVTGAEALYADMGHFGRKPIRIAWYGIVFPSLVLNYAGQAALVLHGAPISDNTFYRLCPSAMLLPLVVLATLATIIASQAVVTGAFSMTRQAIQLGWLPRLRILQTSAAGYGQIYVGTVNWLLMIVTIGLIVGFRKSDNLASAYGIAVSATMLMTSLLLFIAMRDIWKWSLFAAAAVAGSLALVDLAFLSSNMLKIASGGYVPILLAAAVYLIMFIWHTGTKTVAIRLRETVVPIAEFMGWVASEGLCRRVQGTAVFLTRTQNGTPPVMLWYVKHSRALHQYVIALSVVTEAVPWILPEHRIEMRLESDNFWRVTAHYGFMERPNIPALLARAKEMDERMDLSDLTFIVGHETIIARTDGRGLPKWMEAIYAFMRRNSADLTDFFRLPPDRVIEIGREVAI
ncbi:MAG TPA: KUP/HAK/KT family potassium transporter [Alphaproteobacteria bacterium]|nr:KUP/HAK/KT family potassium transporter [Alphaproteobacteria bacterium]